MCMKISNCTRHKEVSSPVQAHRVSGRANSNPGLLLWSSHGKTLIRGVLITSKGTQAFTMSSPDHQQFSDFLLHLSVSLHIGEAQINKWKPRDTLVVNATNRQHNYKSAESVAWHTNRKLSCRPQYKLHSRRQGKAGFDSCGITTLKYICTMWGGFGGLSSGLG